MPSAWTLLWFGWALYFLIVEGMALANSTPGDTLSEHVWAWLGVRRRDDVRLKAGSFTGQLRLVPAKDVTAWTWVRRFAVVFFLAALAIHFVIGSNDVWNVVLAAAGIALALLLAGSFVLFRLGRL